MNKANINRQLNCAIYTRKSTDEGLGKEFNSLDAQRECAEAYIKSQTQEGWHCVPDRYDDGGFTGGNMDRPALKQLLADIESGKVNCVVVYKVDRLSRSLMDFARMLEVFERNQVAFVSVTQQFNTTNSMGRLMLNVLLSFAQFERELISERTRDKIAAARRKGKWSGGMPLLGYDIEPQGGKLRINEVESNRVRAIYDLYLERESIMATIAELDNRGWNNKSWKTKKGTLRGGSPFTKATLFRLLTNVTYIGKLGYKDEVNEGEHDAIISTEVWQKVQSLLRRNGRTGGVEARNKFGAMLKGILRCACCDCSMTPTHTTKNGSKRYRYYVCMKAQKRGWKNCKSKSVPAAEIEKFVVEKIRHVGHDAALVDEVVEQAKIQSERELGALVAERQCAQNRIDNGGWQKTAHEIWAKRCRLNPAPTWMHPNGGLYLYDTETFSRMFERIIQYLIVTFGANDQAADESLIINQLWNDHAETITFLPPDFNVSMLQTPEWATNPVMQSFVYHFIGPSKPHLDRCRWQRSNPPELPFSDNRQSIELINEWKADPPTSYDIGSIFRPDLAANLLATYPNLIVSGTWSDELTVYDERLTSLDETFSSHLVLTRFLIRLGVNARRFKLRIKEGDDATLQLARS